MTAPQEFSARDIPPHPRNVAGGDDRSETEGRAYDATPGVDEPRDGSSEEHDMAGTAQRVAHDVAETIRDGVTPPLKLSTEDRLAALEREVRFLRAEVRRVNESHAHALEGAS